MKKGIVYLICDSVNDLYKIGVTKNVKDKRLKQLQTGNGNELHLINYHQTFFPYRIETMLHNHFSSKNRLNEWYELNMQDISNFKSLCIRFEEVIEVLKDNPFFNKNLR